LIVATPEVEEGVPLENRIQIVDLQVQAGVSLVFDEIFRAGGVRIIKTPPQALRANAICERKGARPVTAR
jgi:hypothetical protein